MSIVNIRASTSFSVSRSARSSRECPDSVKRRYMVESELNFVTAFVAYTNSEKGSSTEFGERTKGQQTFRLASVVGALRLWSVKLGCHRAHQAFPCQ
jgi:hypothetical protein